MSDLLAKVFRSAPEPETTPEDYAALAESVRLQVDAEPPQEVATLPPYDHGAACPKCHYIAGTTQYRRGYHGSDCPIPETPYEPISYPFGLGLSRSWELMAERFRRRSAAIPEHFDRECPNCKHGWAEAVA